MDWFTGTGNKILFDEILELVTSHYQNGGSIHIGTDSQLRSSKCIFSTAICIVGGLKHKNNRYFITRSLVSSSRYSVLLLRIMEEVQKSINIGFKILKYCPTIDIKLHLDVSGENKNTKTSKFSKMLLGHVKGNGFDCKIKPEAWAATTIADRHTKRRKFNAN